LIYFTFYYILINILIFSLINNNYKKRTLFIPIDPEEVEKPVLSRVH